MAADIGIDATTSLDAAFAAALERHGPDEAGYVGRLCACGGPLVAMGYVPRALADVDDGFTIEIIGEKRRAAPQRVPLFDPDGARMRG